MIDLIAEADEAVLDDLIRAVDAADSWEQLGRLAAGLPEARLQRLARQAEQLGLGERLTAILAP